MTELEARHQWDVLAKDTTWKEYAASLRGESGCPDALLQVR